MKKYNYDRLKDAYRQFSAAETEYMKACDQDDEQNQWEKVHRHPHRHCEGGPRG